MTADDLQAEIRRRRAAGQHLKEIARALAAESGWAARDIYRLGLDAVDEG